MIHPSMEGPTSDPDTDTGLEDSMWQLESGGGDPYPERPGEPDCKFFVRTGSCGFGARCRYNHPRDRRAVAGGSRIENGEYPERVGEPTCEYFMKTGYCKFGTTCKFHHPKYGGGSASTVSLNYDGYPLRPGEKECSYYLKTGHCKFGITCKFHHPPPSSISMPAPPPTFYPTVQPHSVPSPISSWEVARPLLPGSYVQGPYGPMLISSGVVQIPGWSPYPQPPINPVASPGTQHAVETGSLYGLMHQLSPLAPAYPGPYSSSSPGPSRSNQKEHIFPERTGQPECRFYLRTGYCKYGSLCRYHHPPERSMPITNCSLSLMGLPLRPGAPVCPFYAQHGGCKFGLTCKFDHPMGTLSYSPSASSLPDMPVVPYPVGSFMGSTDPSSSSSELRPEFVAESSRESFSTRIPLSKNTSSGSVGSIFTKGGAPGPQAHAQAQSSGPSSTPSDGGSSTGHVSENRSLS
ncbi:zinc finger CCCH domain-containing protein 32 [Cinnamomum micranthum f. kanehirae]|uniref:Zinc finger CCCH domain-containing protein 32 n=1 Tax=Cinnamomum micranthum f. kanehirae TaxID=337451 RepID=A0A3S3MX63_9MAGN|nr:zinc finger CCCH domain-containing protein 32 [Cinnamomum micranthum f. kanehirae]